MLQLMDKIIDKPEWDRKVFDAKLIEKWGQEAADAEDMDVTDSMLDYCFAELQAKAVSYRKTGVVSSLESCASVVRSDTIIHPELRQALKVACASLENGPDKDWHPGSDGKVLDLVHPSLFPLVYGRSKALPSGKVGLNDCEDFIGKGVLVPKVEDPDRANDQLNIGWRWGGRQKKNGLSRDFQWLPCDVAFLEDDEVKITSYINNLQPSQHEHLYSVIERVTAKAIPLWDEVLSSVKAYRGSRICMEGTEYEWPQGKEAPEDYVVPEDEREDYGTEEEMDEYERQDKWEKFSRVLVMPDAGEYEKFEYTEMEKVDLRSQFAEQGLQVIVKLANIELTPDKPEYEGGSWHVEGQMNEHICASALYYYSSENISDSFLGFRTWVDSQSLEEKAYGQDDYEGVEQIYGIEQHGPAVQELGRILTKEGRLLAFPNVLQHRVSSFRLADPTKPGHRKILALFLVDPNFRVLSTANIPPQQKSWLSKEVLERSDSLVARTSRLPNELVDKIVKNVSHSTMTLGEAKEIRLRLMEERKALVDQADTIMHHEMSFNFCEH
ncbi:hypothetical protein P7C71_g5428, partial [Lecanoromycetidae sp. Uapishka_2]